MSIIKYTNKERDLLARLMRAEAVGEGDLGMLPSFIVVFSKKRHLPLNHKVM